MFMGAEIQRIHNQFDPWTPLPADDPRYVDCSTERNVPSLFDNFELPLDGEKTISLLFCGQVGDGKTTTLYALKKRLEDAGHFVAYGNADVLLDLGRVEYDNVILMLLATVDQALREEYARSIQEPWYATLWNEFCRVAQLPASLQFDVKVPLGPYAKLTMAVKDTPDLRDRVLRGLRKASSATFQEVVNEYFDRAAEVVKKKKRRALIAIVDNLEKILNVKQQSGSFMDEEVFLGHSTQLTALRCRVIYTVRSALVRVHASNLALYYGAPIFVPMVPLHDRYDKPLPRSLEKLREIVDRRLAAENTTRVEVLESDENLDKLCQASGGHLRDLMILVQQAIVSAKAAHGGLPVKVADVDDAIQRMGALRRNPAMPHQPALQHVVEKRTIYELPTDDQQALFRDRLIHEYFDGDYWYDVCPLIAPLLKKS
jgi:hypothetical protein